MSLEGGLAYVEYEYDDVSGQMLTVRGVNDSDKDMWVRVSGNEDAGEAAGVLYEYTFLANSGTTEWSIPPGQRKQFTLIPDGRGVDGEGEPDYGDTLAGLVVSGGTG